MKSTTTEPAVAQHAIGDERLVVAAREGDAQALSAVMAKYRGVARAKASNYFLVGGDRDDVLQEAMIGLYKAIRDFDPDHGASFRSFAELCITRQVLTAIKSATRLKHTPLNHSVSFDRPTDDYRYSLSDTVPSEHAPDPLQLLVSDAGVRELRETFRTVLSELETRVLALYVDGRSYQEIAEELGRQVKSIDNALQRIKRKLAGHVDEMIR